MSRKFGGAPSGSGPAGGGVVGASPAPPGGPVGPDVSGPILTGGYNEGDFGGDILDVTGAFGDIGSVYYVTVINGVLEIINADSGEVISVTPDLADFLEGEGVDYDTTGPSPDGDSGEFVGEYDETNTTEIEVVFGGSGSRPGGGHPGVLLPRVPRSRPRLPSVHALKIIRAILEPSGRYVKDGQRYLADLVRSTAFIGVKWDEVRDTLHDILDPHIEVINDSITSGDMLPDVAEEALTDGLEYIRTIITLEAVPIPIPVPVQYTEDLPGYDEGGLIPSFIGLLLLLEWIRWLSGRSQAPSPQSTTQPPPPTPGPRDEEQGDDQESDPQSETDTRPQPRLVPYPQPIGDPSDPKEEIDFKGNCVFYRLRPQVWLKYCPRIRKRRDTRVSMRIGPLHISQVW